jgi:hypothetical protein
LPVHPNTIFFHKDFHLLNFLYVSGRPNPPAAGEWARAVRLARLPTVIIFFSDFRLNVDGLRYPGLSPIEMSLAVRAIN